MGMPVIVDRYITSINRPNKRNLATYVAVHWTANEDSGADAIANAHYLDVNDRKASAHYVVDSIQAIRCIPEDEIANSVGALKYTNWCKKNIGTNPNAHVISIEMCVNADGDFWKMYSHSVYLVADILHRHKWGIERLIRHYDVTGKDCPRFFTDNKTAQKYIGKNALQAWQDFRNNVNRILKEMN